MSDDKFYPLAKQGVFHAIQGEGALLGLPQVFVRFAGCPVGCPACDTDYRVHVRSHVDAIVNQVRAAAPDGWVWLTGGEPAVYDLLPLVTELRRTHRVALATAGIRAVDHFGCDFISVSPHDPLTWVQRAGSELKLVAGLNGVRLSDFVGHLGGIRFDHLWVCPLMGRENRPDAAALAECVEWVRRNPGWRLGVQAHKLWNLP